MPKNTKLSDRVRAVSQERVDLIDFNRLQEMIDQTVRRQMGGVLGEARGLTSVPATTFSWATKKLSFGRFAYCLVEPASDSMTDVGTTNRKGWRGGFYHFNPTDPSQPAAFDMAVAATAASNGDATLAYPLVLVRPQSVDTATEARVHFAAGAETPFATQTKTSLWHEIKFSTTLTGYDEWAPIGVVSAWSAFNSGGDPGTPTIRPISWMDNYMAELRNGQSADYWIGDGDLSVSPLLQVASGAGGGLAGLDYAVATGSMDVGLVQMLAFLRAQIQRILDDTKATAWWKNPDGSGLTTALAGGLTQLWDRVAPMWQRYNVDQVVLPWASARVHFTAGPNTYSFPAAVTGSPRNMLSASAFAGGGGVLIQCAPPPAGWKYAHAVATIPTNETPLTLPGTNVHRTASAKVTVSGSNFVNVFLRKISYTQDAVGLVTSTEMVQDDADFDLTVFITKDV